MSTKTRIPAGSLVQLTGPAIGGLTGGAVAHPGEYAIVTRRAGTFALAAVDIVTPMPGGWYTRTGVTGECRDEDMVQVAANPPQAFHAAVNKQRRRRSRFWR